MANLIDHELKSQAGFKKLKIWQKGMEIARLVYQSTREFPEEEKFCLVAQMRRAAISIPSNIAEGYARKNEKEFKQFTYVALGSLAELETQCLLASDFGFLPAHSEIFELVEITRRMILKVCHFDKFNIGEKNEN